MVGRALAALLLLVVFGYTGFLYWFHHRPSPPPVDKDLFEGVHYTRSIRKAPRPLVVHIVTVNTEAPGLRFLVTPGDPTKRLPLTGKLTTAFLRENKLQLAVNADFFEPWHSRAPWDYYPHVGDPVQVKGFAASRGVVYADGPTRNRRYTLALSADNRLSIGYPPSERVCNAVSGRPMLVWKGQQEDLSDESRELNPRVAAGLSRDRKTLILLLVDGRQPGFSEGVTLMELADLLIEAGAYDAVNLDGGGSATLAVERADGKPEILNCPINHRIPMQERPVANHLGIFARRLNAPSGR